MQLFQRDWKQIIAVKYEKVISKIFKNFVACKKNIFDKNT